jgi:hypothetical protein
MSRRGTNWAGVRMRRVLHRQGSESKRGEVPFMAPLMPSKPRLAQPSKEELRAEAVRAFLEWRAAKRAKRSTP